MLKDLLKPEVADLVLHLRREDRADLLRNRELVAPGVTRPQK
jgi:hypothetical protein